MKPCKIKGCNTITKNGRICSMHRNRWWRYKDYNYISPKWTILRKGQPHLTNYGYYRILVDGKRVLQHRYIMEQSLGRKLNPRERVHHKNGVRTDNRIENLELMSSQSEHIHKHHPDIWKKRKKNNPHI